MSVELSKEIWNEIKRYVNVVDRDEAAETLVSVLIDNDIAADKIKETFKSDGEVKRALAHYLKDLEDDDDEEDFQDDDDGDDEDY
jgi:hypothetical protein